MGKFQKIKYYLGKIKINWKTKYRLVIKNDTTHQDKLSFRLSPMNVFVVGVTSALVLIFLTIILIAFTPLRVYVPGYTRPSELRKYQLVASKVDSLEQKVKVNQQYIDNFYNVIHGKTFPVEPEVSENRTSESRREATEEEKARIAQANDILQRDSETILRELNAQHYGGASMPIGRKADIGTLLLSSPTSGTIVSEFNTAKDQFGINIKNHRNTLVNSVGDGVVIYSGYDPIDGNTIIIQHSGNVITIYKHNETLLKNKGYIVKRGEPIARMGNSGKTSWGVNLYFELWYNGFPVNPLDYIVIN